MNKGIKITLTILVFTLITLAVVTFVPWKTVSSSMQNFKVYSQEHLQNNYEKGIEQGISDKEVYEKDISLVKQEIQELIQSLNEIKSLNLIEEKTQQDLLKRIQELTSEIELAKEPNYVENKIAEVNQLINETQSKINELKSIFKDVCIVDITGIILNENNEIVEKLERNYSISGSATPLLNIFKASCNVKLFLTGAHNDSVESNYITLNYITIYYPSGLIQKEEFYADKKITYFTNGTVNTYGGSWKSTLNFNYPLQKLVIVPNYSIK